MEAESRYTYVGLAMVALLVAMVAAVVWLRNTGRAADFTNYTIYFERQRLDGLQIGSDVDMRGIRIGRVEDYQLDPARVNRVRVVIRIDRRTPISDNTGAVVARNFVTGLARISLVTPNPPGPPLTEAPGQENPVIPEGQSDLDEIAGKVNRLGDMAADSLENLNQLLVPENRAAFAASLRNFRDLTAGLNQRLDRVDRSLASFDAAAGQLGSAGERMARTAETAGARLGPALAQTEATLKDLSATARALEAQANALGRRVDVAVAGLDDQTTVAVTELRVAVDAANRVLDRMNDPRAAVLGPSKAQLGPGEKAP